MAKRSCRRTTVSYTHLDVYKRQYVDIAARRECELVKSKSEVEKKQAEMEAIGFDATALTVPVSYTHLCVLGTYREKVSQKVSVKVAGGTYVEKVH